MKFVNRIITAEHQGLHGIGERLIFPHKTVKGLHGAKEHSENADQILNLHESAISCIKYSDLSSNLCDDLQVFDERALCGQEFLSDEVGLICGKLLDTSTNT